MKPPEKWKKNHQQQHKYNGEWMDVSRYSLLLFSCSLLVVLLLCTRACVLSAKPNQMSVSKRERKKSQNRNEEKQLLISLDHFDINNTKTEYNNHIDV